MWKPQPDTRTLKHVLDDHADNIETPRVVAPGDLWVNATLDCYGTDHFVITEKHIQALRDGFILRFAENGGEYQAFLVLKKEE